VVQFDGEGDAGKRFIEAWKRTRIIVDSGSGQDGGTTPTPPPTPTPPQGNPVRSRLPLDSPESESALSERNRAANWSVLQSRRPAETALNMARRKTLLTAAPAGTRLRVWISWGVTFLNSVASVAKSTGQDPGRYRNPVCRVEVRWR